jgi:hypothetical protein
VQMTKGKLSGQHDNGVIVGKAQNFLVVVGN